MVIFHSYVHVYQRVIREIIPKWPQFRLVKYDIYNLPRYLCIATLLMTPSNPSNPSSMAHMERDSTKKAWDLGIYMFCFCVEKTTTSNVWKHVVAIPCLSPMGFQKPDIFWLSRGSRSMHGANTCWCNTDGKKTTRTGTSARVDQSSQKELAFWCCFTCLFRISEVATLSLSGCTLWFGICPEMGDLERESFICKMMRNHWIFWDTLTFRPNQVLYTPEIDDSSQMYHGDVSSECSPMHPTTHQCCTRQVEQGEIPAVPWLPVPLDPQKICSCLPQRFGRVNDVYVCVCISYNIIYIYTYIYIYIIYVCVYIYMYKM